MAEYEPGVTMLELIKNWPPSYQLGALGIIVIGCVAVVVLICSYVSNTLIVLKHGHPPPLEPVPFEPDPPVFKYSYNGPPEHAPAWARPPKPDTDPAAERTDS